MASSVGKLAAFDIENGNWRNYCDRVEMYFIVNGTKEELKVPTLISVVGDAAYELMINLCSPRKPKECTYGEIVQVISEHIQPKPSFLAERYKFRQCRQEGEQTIAMFVAELKKSSRFCEFSSALDDNMRDQFVCGIKSDIIRQRLFAEEKVTWQKAVALASTLEAAERDSHVVEKGGSVAVNAITRGRQSTREDGSSSMGSQALVRRSTLRCWACGEDGHRRGECRFRSFVCSGCQEIGHLRRMCPGKNSRGQEVSVARRGAHAGGYRGAGIERRGGGSKVANSNHYWVRGELDESDRDIVPDLEYHDGTEYEDGAERAADFEEEALHLMSLGCYKPVCLPIKIENQEVVMEIDTGSAISCISKETYKRLFSNFNLLLTDLTLKFYDGSKIQPLGYLDMNVKYKGISKRLHLYVIDKGSTSLLGRQWLAELGITIPPVSVNVLRSENVDKNKILSKLISRHESLFEESLGRFTGGKVSLHVREGAAPVYCRARPLPYALRERVDAELDAMLRAGVIEPVDASDWATPLVIARKADGGIRICADYKVTLNQMLLVDRYPVPKVEDLLTSVNGNIYFSKLDLSHAYNQCELDEPSKMFTVINTHRGLFKYNRLVYGLSSSPGIFQKIMQNLLKDIPNVINFFDDILIMSKDLDSHIDTLNKVFTRLRESGLKLKKSKCVFLTNKVKFLGFMIDKDGVSVDAEKIKPILEMTSPGSVSELRSFLGMANFYGKFIYNLSFYTSPLYNLLKKGVAWQWSREHEEAFRNIKKKLTSTEALAHFDSSRMCVVTCDASAHGLGAVLAQRGPDGSERAVAYASRALTQHEIHYSQIHKEALAIIFAVTKFHQYLYGRKFVLRTDHKPLVSIFGREKGIPVTAASRLQRWAIILTAYDFNIEYISTDKNTADALSRLIKSHKESSGEEAGQIPEQTYLHFASDALLLDYNILKNETSKDVILSRIVRYIKDGWPREMEIEGLKPYFNRKDELYTELGTVLWGHRVVVPTACRDKVLKELHDTHMGVVKTKSLARSYVWWPGMDEAIQAQCRACPVCAVESDAPPAHVPRPWPWPTRPWTRLHLDFLGPLEGLTYLVIVDAGSKWLEAIRMRGTTANAVVGVLRNLWARFGIPRQIVSDNGPPFTSAEFKEFLKRNGVEQVRSAPYHPASNGAAENAVKICKNVIKKALKQKINVDTALDRYLLTYRNTEHTTTGVSPAQALQGRSLRTRLDCLKPDVEGRVRAAQLRQQESAGGSERQVKVGDQVWFRQYRQPDKWVPGEVVERLGNTDYNILDKHGTEVHRHIDQLKGRSSLTTFDKPNKSLRSSLIFPDNGAEEEGGRLVAQPGLPGSPIAQAALASSVERAAAFPSPPAPARDCTAAISETRPVRARKPPNRYGFEFD